MTSKRLLDLILVIPGVVLLSPLFVIVAVWIWLDTPGPILFRQKRVGQYGKIFHIMKFRTMEVDAENKGPSITVDSDCRITRSGRILRKYKLDELPQLFNVLKGEMSLVGPRPEVPQYVALYPEEARKLILSVRPGITDPASIRFRNESALLAKAEDPQRFYVEKILPEKLDIYLAYVSNRTLIGDLCIIGNTLASIIR